MADSSDWEPLAICENRLIERRNQALSAPTPKEKSAFIGDICGEIRGFRKRTVT